MEVFLAVAGIIILLIGFVGCFVPVLPGPPLAYISLLLLQIGPDTPYSLRFMIVMALAVAGVTFVDYLIPAIGAKRWGGSRYGIIGALAGVVVGLFIFPPFGFILFPFLGALAGEMLGGSNTDKAFKAAFGTFIGWILGTMLKFSTTVVIAYYFFSNL
ncbi:MAG: DUF456 domain-containing protein [Cytophagales bacterium]|nr:DUF456 domain-containing protein [Cytophagales bacterium]